MISQLINNMFHVKHIKKYPNYFPGNIFFYLNFEHTTFINILILCNMDIYIQTFFLEYYYFQMKCFLNSIALNFSMPEILIHYLL